ISILLLGLEVRAVVLSGILNLITATVAYELSLPLSNQLSDISYLLLLTGIIGLLIPNKVNVKAGVFSLVSLLFLLQPAHEYSLIFLSIGVSSLFPPLAIVYAISLALILHSYYLLSLSLLYPVLRYVKLTGFLPFSLDFIILQHLDVVDWLVALVIGVITGIVSKRDSWSYLISSVSLFLLSYLVTNSITNVMMIPFITLGYSLGVLIPMSVRTSSPPSFILTLTPSVVLLLSILSFIYYGISDVVYLAFVFSLAYFLFRTSNLVRPFLSIDLAVFLTLISPFVLAYSLFVKWKYRFILSLLYLASFPLLFHTIPLELLAVSAVTLFPTLKWKYSNLLPGSLIIPYAF
ncbi:MAG: hypothetical protein JZD40_00610, partial [Sulfolobus sp.]|nr:hypothetical protein [Sulfolobus sp.]